MSGPTPPPANDRKQDDEPPSDEILTGEFVLGVLEATQRGAIMAQGTLKPAAGTV